MTNDDLIDDFQNLRSRQKRTLALFGIAWFFAILIHFLFLNPWSKPLRTAVPIALIEVVFQSGPFLSGLGHVFVSAVTHAGALLVFGIVGWVYVHRRLPGMKRFQEISLAVLMGMALVGLPLHLLGSLHFLGRWPAFLTPAAVLALLFLLPRCNAGSNPSEVKTSIAEPKPDRWIRYIAWGLVWAITILTFYHALGFPVDYWDALIYYVDYAQRTWEQGGFPTIVCGQVGIGLGANYPHLFHVLQALGAYIAGTWSDLYGQLLPPVLGVLTLGLLAGLLQNLFANRLITALGVLAFRSIPYGFTYQVWVSDYSLVMACTAGFFFCIERFLSERNWRWYEAAAFICAAMPTINYLGWIYFPILAAAPILIGRKEFPLKQILQRAAPFFVLSLFLAIPWYIRNIIVTGNPVYAFFSSILDGKRIDPQVMESCRIEWLSNGDGPAQLGRTLFRRLILSPWYFLVANPSWKLGPLFTGLLLPGFFFAFAYRKKRGIYTLMMIFTLLLLFYEYGISGLYLYHALGFLPVYACFAASFLAFAGPKIRPWLALAILIGALCPGLSFALMGPKMQEGQTIATSLPALRYGPLDKERFYQIRFPGEADLWRKINTELEPHAKILTHENRYHLFRRDITLVHLDGWEVSRLYGKPFDEVMKWLNKNGVHYYLKIPNEANHPILTRLGHNRYLKNPAYFQEIARSGKTILYRIMPPKEKR